MTAFCNALTTTADASIVYPRRSASARRASRSAASFAGILTLNGLLFASSFSRSSSCCVTPSVNNNDDISYDAALHKSSVGDDMGGPVKLGVRASSPHPHPAPRPGDRGEPLVNFLAGQSPSPKRGAPRRRFASGGPQGRHSRPRRERSDRRQAKGGRRGVQPRQCWKAPLGAERSEPTR